MFIIGETYTRDEIHSRVGGGVQDYLPHRDGVVVCGCFNPDINPDAPDLVLVGTGPDIERWARVFGSQHAYVPVFLKQRTNEWEYVGDFRGRYLSDDRRAIERYKDRSGRDDITMLLFLEQK